MRKCARHHNESAVARSTRRRHSDSASLRSRSHMDDVERHECTVNSNELAVHGRALQRSKHQLPFSYRKNPSVCPHCLGKKDAPIRTRDFHAPTMRPWSPFKTSRPFAERLFPLPPPPRLGRWGLGRLLAERGEAREPGCSGDLWWSGAVVKNEVWAPKFVGRIMKKDEER